MDNSKKKIWVEQLSQISFNEGFYEPDTLFST